MAGLRDGMAAVALVMASAVAAPACTVPAGSARMRAELVAEVNAERRRAGRPVLAVSPQLQQVAQDQACDNALYDRVSHADAAGRGLAARLGAVGYGFRAANENITPVPSAVAAVGLWMGSRRHRGNLLDRRATQVGAGVAQTAGGRTYWVFVSARPM